MRILLRNNRGFTLIELMVAIMIASVGLLGLLGTMNVAMQHNLTNMLRDEAVLVGEKSISFQKVRPFDQVSSSHFTVPSKLRGGGMQYSVACGSVPWPPSPATPTAKQLIVTVTWTYKGTGYSHEVRSIRSE